MKIVPIAVGFLYWFAAPLWSVYVWGQRVPFTPESMLADLVQMILIMGGGYLVFNVGGLWRRQ